MADYLASAHAALGCLPTQDQIVLERFFDEVGGMQLVIHSPFGSRINRAWGLALRKHFAASSISSCRRRLPRTTLFSPLPPPIVSSWWTVSRYLIAATIRPLLVQALLDAPLCSRPAGAGSPALHSRCRGFVPAGKCPRSCSAWGPKIYRRRLPR